MELWYPQAIKITPQLTSRGKYPKEHPEGAIVHFTAGRYGRSALASARQQGLAYFLIEKDGRVNQALPLNEWGYHAGVSKWNPLGTGSVSARLVGIEIECAGLLKKAPDGSYKTWFGTEIQPEDVREIKEKKDNRTPGAYHKYTREQEIALVELLIWLKGNAPDIFSFDLVLGHDEVSEVRKQDPGGALSVSMPTFRENIKSLWKVMSRAKVDLV